MIRKAGVVLALLIIGSLAACDTAAPTAEPSKITEPLKQSTPTASSSQLTVATRAFCRNAMRDGEQGLDAITKLVENPDGKGLTAEDFSVPRDNLTEDHQIAPPHLQSYLKTQIDVLNDIVIVFSGGEDRSIQTGEYRDAGISFVSACGKDVEGE